MSAIVSLLSHWQISVCIFGLVLAVTLSTAAASDADAPASPYAQWKNGPSTDPNYFPIGVSTQDPSLAEKFKAVGINLFLRLWDGPTDRQIEYLRKAGMQTICNQNELGLQIPGEPIIGWTLEDEPDLAKPMVHTWKNDHARIKQAWPELTDEAIRKMGRYGPPIPAEWILEEYKTFKRMDPTRPVRLNLSMAVAYPKFKGRGMRSGHDEDYKVYAKACDIISFDIYPYNDPAPEVRGNLYYQAIGLNRLKELTGGEKPIWNYIETTKIFKNGRKPPKDVIRSQVWMSIIHGSRGIIYFCHGVHPETGAFWDKALASDAEQMENLKPINAEVASLAAVINSPEVKGAAMNRTKVRPAKELSSKGIQAVASTVRIHDGYMYIFAARMEDTPADSLFILRRPIAEGAEVEVIGENRTIKLERTAFSDNFAGYGVHLYKIKLAE